MVFLLLSTVALFALVAAHFYALKASQGSQQRQAAANLAYSYLQKAESHLRRDFAESQDQDLATVPEAAGFRLRMRDQYEPDGLDNLKLLDCSVYWDEAGQVREFKSHLEVYRGR